MLTTSAHQNRSPERDGPPKQKKGEVFGRLLDDATARHLLVVEPLFMPMRQLKHFVAVGVRVHGHEVDVAFDVDGTRFGGAPGLAVWLDGRLAARTKTLRRLEVAVSSSSQVL